MQFINPLNDKIQMCNPHIYHKDKISKPDLNTLLLHLYQNRQLKYNKQLSLRILRKLPYKDCCDILMTSNLKFINTKNNKNYTKIDCLELPLNELKNLAKNNFISISNNKNFLCNELMNLKYKFKDDKEIIKNANINKMRISIVATNTINDNQLPLSVLIKRFGINIYTHTKQYIYIPKIYITDIDINIINNNISITLNNNVTYTLQYKNINTDKNIIKLYPKYILDYTKLLMYLNSIYSDIEINTPTKHNIISWTQDNCKNYANCSNKLNQELLLDNKICVKNNFIDDYINIDDLIQLNDGNCYNISDIKNLIKFDDIQEIKLSLTDLEKQYVISL